jgi:serine/threonine protein kinase
MKGWKNSPNLLFATRLAETYIGDSKDELVIAGANILSDALTGAWRGMGVDDYVVQINTSESKIVKSALRITGVDKYNFGQEQDWTVIGTGSYGSVYKTMGIAIKKIPFNSPEWEPLYVSALIEVSALIRTRSKYVINLLGAKYVNECFYICLDLAISSFYGYKGDITVEQLLSMTECVKYLHNKGIIHMDVKPENFLLTQDYRIVIADMGTCILYPETRPYTTDGTINYMDYETLTYQINMSAPIESSSTRRVTAPSEHNYTGMDVWGLGCTFVALLSGAYPYFRGQNSSGTCGEILDDIDHKLQDLTEFDPYTSLLDKMFQTMHVNRCDIDEVVVELRML